MNNALKKLNIYLSTDEHNRLMREFDKDRKRNLNDNVFIKLKI